MFFRRSANSWTTTIVINYCYCYVLFLFFSFLGVRLIAEQLLLLGVWLDLIQVLDHGYFSASLQRTHIISYDAP